MVYGSQLGMLWLVFFLVSGCSWLMYVLIVKQQDRRLKTDVLLQLRGARGIAVTSMQEGGAGFVRIGSDIWPVVALGIQCSSISAGQFVRIQDIQDNQFIISRIEE